MKRVVEISEIEIQRIEGELARLSGRIDTVIRKMYMQCDELDAEIGDMLSVIAQLGDLEHSAQRRSPDFEMNIAAIEAYRNELDGTIQKLTQLRLTSNQALVST